MSVRIRRKGTTDIKDHHDLLNRGTRTHAEIDTYLNEIDLARSTFPDLGERIKATEDKNTKQDGRLTSIETKNTEQDTKLTSLDTRVTGAETKNTEQDIRLTNLETASQEVVNARTDQFGNVYGSLKERLDTMKGSGGSGIGSGYYLFEVYQNTIQGNLDVTLATGTYEVGAGELEVFKNGVRLTRSKDFTEVSETAVKFIELLNTGDIVVFRVRNRGQVKTGLHTEYEILQTIKSNFILSKNFSRPGRTLEVYYNGVLLSQDLDYLASDSSVSLRFEPVIGSLFLFQVVDTNGSNSPKLIEELLNPSTPTQRDFTLSKFSYQVGSNELELYLNGIKITKDVDYLEVDSSNFKLLHDPGESTLLAVKENSVTLTGSANTSQTSEVIVDTGLADPSINYSYTVPTGETTDTVTLPSPYMVGTGELIVFWNGMVISYQEIDSYTIKLPTILVEGDMVFVHRPRRNVVKLNRLSSVKQSSLSVNPGNTVVFTLPIGSSAVELRYIRVSSAVTMNALFEVIESPTDSIDLLAMDCNSTRKDFVGSQPYNDDMSSNNLYIRVTNRGLDSITFDLAVKYVLYNS